MPSTYARYRRENGPSVTTAYCAAKAVVVAVTSITVELDVSALTSLMLGSVAACSEGVVVTNNSVVFICSVGWAVAEGFIEITGEIEEENDERSDEGPHPKQVSKQLVVMYLEQ